MSDAITPSDEPQEFDLHNQIVQATFIGPRDTGLLFDLGDDQTALVAEDEYDANQSFAEGARVEILVEKSAGAY